MSVIYAAMLSDTVIFISDIKQNFYVYIPLDYYNSYIKTMQDFVTRNWRKEDW